MRDSKLTYRRKLEIISITAGLILVASGLLFWKADSRNSALAFFVGIFIIIMGIFELLRLSRTNVHEQSKELITRQIKFYNEILKDDPNNIKVLIDKGSLLFKLEQYYDAVECFNRALEIEPNNLEATAKRRFTLEKLDNYNNTMK